MKIRLTLGALQDPPGWFGLVWEHEGACFPYVGYMDFGADVLGQWTVAARELLRGADLVQLPFVEGDYRLSVSRVDPVAAGPDADVVVLPEGVDPPISWPTTVRDFAALVLQAAETVCEQLPDATADLPTDAKRLRELLEQETV